MPDTVKPLPAFAAVGDGIDLWPETKPCNWSEQNGIGRDRAEEVLEVMRRQDAPNLLGHVIEAMVRHGNFDGVAVGFCHVIGITVMQPPVREFVEVPREPVFSSSRKAGCLRLVNQ